MSVSNLKGQAKYSDLLHLRVTALLLLVIFLLLSAVGVAFFLQQNEERAQKLIHQQELQAQLAVLEAEKARLDQQSAMVGQPQYVERVARDELGMVQKDEIVFQNVD